MTRPCLANVVQVAAGSYHTCALREGGFVQCWGKNEDGQLGNGGTANTATPTSTTNYLPMPASLGAGYAHTCTTTTGGVLYCWGVGAVGRPERRTSPFWVTGVTEAIAVVAGHYTTCFLARDGSVSCWFDTLTAPVRPAGLPSATAVSLARGGSKGGCVLANGGAVWCWKGTQAPSALAGLTATSLSAGGEHFCAVATDRSVWCWGSNASGQLGDGKTSDTEVPPVKVSDVSEAMAVSAGFTFSCALIADGSVRCWGNNFTEQLGIGNTTPTFTRVPVLGVSGAKAISSGNGHTCALMGDGGVQCWGDNGHGQLGSGFSRRGDAGGPGDRRLTRPDQG